jgi:ABC-type transport system involved in cytochrome c biogenesis permease subunit
MKFIKNLIKTAASLKLTVFCLLVICILVTWGTFYQVDFGIYAAQKRFFDSWFFLIAGLIPFPALKSVIVVLALNLLVSGACRFSLRVEKFGVFLMHIGTVALITGTAFSSFLINESMLSLFEGEKSNVSIKPSEWEIAFFKKENGNLTNAGFHNIDHLKPGSTIPFFRDDISISVEQIYQNCEAYGTSPHKIESLKPIEIEHSRDKNIPGLILSVSGKDATGLVNSRAFIYGGAGVPAHCLIGSDTLLISLQPGHFKLPVEIELIKFTKEEHPGTETAKSYSSRVRVSGPELNREVVISMNRPFRYKSFTFYQTSYSMQHGRTASTLSVVENPVRFVPYLTGIIIMLGLLYHFICKFAVSGFKVKENSIFNKKRNHREMRSNKAITSFTTIFSIILVWFCSNLMASNGSNEVSVEALGRVIVLEEGRKKPLDTYARNKLIQFSGKKKISGSTALQWLSRVLLNPDAANDDLIFLINNPEVADALGITPRAKRRYSFFELYNASQKLSQLASEAMKKDRENWTAFDREIINTERNLDEFFLLRSAFSFLEPTPYLQISDSSLSQMLRLPLNKPVSYFELLSRAESISEEIKLIQQKGIDSLSQEDQAVVDLARRMYDMENSLNNPPPHLIPDTRNSEGKWLSLWGLVNQYKSRSLKQNAMMSLIQIREAYLERDQKRFDESVLQFNNLVRQQVSAKERLPDPTLELFYNKLNPFLCSKILYGLAALISLLSMALLWKKVYTAGYFLVIAGMVLHTGGIILRMIIMSHPPVTNLYETFIFTAWAAVIIGIVLEWLRIGSIGTITAAITGFLFIHIAGKYAGDGDTMGMLIAVLNSSFWLTTHIVTISLGYAGYIGAGLIGHIYLIHKMIKSNDTLQLQTISKAIKGIFYFGLLFTVMGTMFGGMWADQAWGRFWGWDPKENGALLLILWGLIVIHAKRGGMINNTGYAMGAVIGTVLVMSVWIGVNLLGVGMHTYGFTSSGAMALMIYIGTEIVFLTVCAIVLYRKKPQTIISR